ncbi:hypothetical protein [Thalassotalea sediminis]|uniref:hypothetical protein n=1 Tax=Thalassotalea sediminis TaxID=1759089 RepID=UPI002572F330|nr:hypothetical protein [Thalassotalea sediminis]
MSRHTKLAMFLAPFLILGGYVLSDFYLESQASKLRLYELQPFGHCDVINQKCVLKSKDFKINVTHENGITTVNSTFPLDTATFFIVDNAKNPRAYQLGMKDTPYYWKRETALGELIPNKGDKTKLRFIGEIKGGKYIAEFYTQTVK